MVELSYQNCNFNLIVKQGTYVHLVAKIERCVTPIPQSVPTFISPMLEAGLCQSIKECENKCSWMDRPGSMGTFPGYLIKTLFFPNLA